MTLPGRSFTDEQVQVVARELVTIDGCDWKFFSSAPDGYYTRQARRILDALARHAEEK